MKTNLRTCLAACAFFAAMVSAPAIAKNVKVTMYKTDDNVITGFVTGGNATSLIVSQMLQRSGRSRRGIERGYGFAPAMVSRWASGELQSGAELASVKALAAALGYRVRLVLEERT